MGCQIRLDTISQSELNYEDTGQLPDSLSNREGESGLVAGLLFGWNRKFNTE
ncbi:hypothetical protein Mal48_07680 [Thalassoglobus polymorphus]|uniref:Uncharacterized protein n=1 Tax=Thalassoglobus polymorphus TaxID=2527994 RepID=A0A517QIT9_9PLAN|nr:hypothetical protein Mal48_07680 [Thalassoglobus polymorphus]